MKNKKIQIFYPLFSSLISLLIMLNGMILKAQNDSLVYELGFPFQEGIYGSSNEFRANQPAIQEKIESKNNQLYIWDDSTQTMVIVDPQKVWGYSLAGNVYISFENAFWRLINIGQLSQFSAIIVRTIRTVDSFGFPIESQSRSIAQFFIDIQTAEVYELTAKNLIPFVEDSPEVTSKFKNIKRIKAKGLVLVIKTYNEYNPIYFPVYE